MEGQVRADGTIAHGIHFTVEKTGTGRYTVNFDQPFTGIPFVLIRPANVNHTIGTNNITANSFQVEVNDLDKTAEDQAFCFLARDYVISG